MDKKMPYDDINNIYDKLNNQNMRERQCINPSIENQSIRIATSIVNKNWNSTMNYQIKIADIKSEIKSYIMNNGNSAKQSKTLNKDIVKQVKTGPKNIVLQAKKKKTEKLDVFYENLNYLSLAYEIIIEKKKKLNEQNFISFVEFLDEIKSRIKDEYTNNFDLKLEIEFEINSKDKDNISAIYTFYLPNTNKKEKKLKFKEYNVLKYKTNSETQAFQYLIQEINDEKYSKRTETSLIETEFSLNNQANSNTISSKLMNDSLPVDLNISQNDECDKIKIIKFLKIIGEHEEKKNNYSAEFIKELCNGYFVSAGTDSKIIVYNENFQIYEEIITIKEWTYSICERLISKQNNGIQFLGCSNKEVFLAEIKEGKFINYLKYKLPETTCTNCVEMKDNDYVIVGPKGGHYYTNLFKQGRHKIQNHVITDKTYRGAIKIGKDIVALTSNSLDAKGEDSLIIYDCSKETKKEKDKKNKKNKVEKKITTK
jgi:hypothetical protein